MEKVKKKQRQLKNRRGRLKLDFATRDLPDQVAIGVEEIEPSNLVALHPLQLLENSVLHLAFIVEHTIKLQLHLLPFSITMPDAGDLFPNRSGNPQLFLKLALERRYRIFLRLDLSAWKLPFERHRTVFRSLANQNLAIVGDDTRNDLLHSRLVGRSH